MNATTTGWIVLITALGAMMGLLAADVAALKSFHDAFTPVFVGAAMGHLATVIAAFVAGKQMPTERDPDLRTRKDDKGK